MYRHDSFEANNVEGKQSSAKMGLGRYKYVPLILSLMSTLTLLVCIATDFWYIVELSSKKQTNEGLWRKCISGKCTGYSGDIESWFQAVRAFMLLSVITTVIGIIFFLIALRYHKLALVYSSGFLVSCLVLFFALALYGIKQSTIGKEKYVVSFGYSYICGWLSGTLSCISAVVGFYDVRRHPAEPATGKIEITVSTDSLDAEIDE